MLIGERINDRYKILDFIGGGGMANVYLARDMILERDVAIKILRLDFANDDEFIRRFHREAQSATSLVHPNIVNIYDVGEEKDIYYIVMEYVEGKTLKQYIQDHHPIPIEKAVDIMLQITSAISHAHQNNIIHRDIKPQNILIDNKGNVKITDFGIAIALTSTTITHTNSVMGSVHYISPEQARGGLATKKSDIYSLGIVLFELLTGKLPFEGESAVSIALKHLQKETPHPRSWNPDIPQSVENIVLKATAKDPHYRYEDMEALIDDLNTCLNPERLNEPVFVLPIDDEATKAIPVIKEPQNFTEIQETIISPQSEEDEEDNNGKAKPKGKKGKSKKSAKKSKTNKKKRKKWPIILTSTAVLIVLFGILIITFFPSIFGAKEIEVPDVTELELDEAIEMLEDAGFVIGETIEQPHDEIPENFVIKTNPKAGKKKVEGSQIDIYVSTGKETIEMLDLIGQNYKDVLEELENEEIEFIDIKLNEVYDNSEPGTIIEQDPEPGEEIIPDETVLTLTVSQGVETFTLTDLTQYSRSALNDYAERHGITIEEEEEYSDKVQEGLVISQEPKPGTELKEGDTVKVIISKGVEPVPRTEEIEFTIAYTGQVGEDGPEPQEVQIFIQDMNHEDFEVPVDTFEITESVTRKISLTIAPNTTAKYRVVVDGEVVRNVEIPYTQ